MVGAPRLAERESLLKARDRRVMSKIRTLTKERRTKHEALVAEMTAFRLMGLACYGKWQSDCAADPRTTETCRVVLNSARCIALGSPFLELLIACSMLATKTVRWGDLVKALGRNAFSQCTPFGRDF
jgi:hypothetical protein